MGLGSWEEGVALLVVELAGERGIADAEDGVGREPLG